MGRGVSGGGGGGVGDCVLNEHPWGMDCHRLLISFQSCRQFTNGKGGGDTIK